MASAVVIHYYKDKGYTDTSGKPVDFSKVKADARKAGRNVDVVHMNDRSSDYTIDNKPVLPKKSG